MIVSALVVTLASDPVAGAMALDDLASDPRLTLGEARSGRLPVVAETDSMEAGAELCDALGRRPGVVRVDVVAIDFSLDSSEVQ